MPCLETIIRNMYLKEDHMSGKTVIVMGKKGVVANKTGSDGDTTNDEIYNVRFEDGGISTHPVRDMQMIGESVELDEAQKREFEKGDVVVGRRGNFKGTEAVVVSIDPSGGRLVVSITSKRKVRVNPSDWNKHPTGKRIRESVEAEEDKAEEDKKVTCPKCDGEGCEHCDGKGYHLESVELDEKVMGAAYPKGHPMRKFETPASPELKKWIESGKAKIIVDGISVLGPTTRFVVVQNPKWFGGDKHDPVLMFTISDPKRGRIKMFSFHGSHVSHQNAMKFAKNNKLVEKEDAKGNPLYAKESVELDEDYKEMMKWYEKSDEKKVYDILKKNKFNLPADSFTLVQNTLKKSKNVHNAASMIMLKYPQFRKESVEHLDEMQPHGMFGGQKKKSTRPSRPTRIAVDKEFAKVNRSGKMDTMAAKKHLEKKFKITDVRIEKDKNGKAHVTYFQESVELDEVINSPGRGRAKEANIKRGRKSDSGGDMVITAGKDSNGKVFYATSIDRTSGDILKVGTNEKEAVKLTKGNAAKLVRGKASFVTAINLNKGIGNTKKVSDAELKKLIGESVELDEAPKADMRKTGSEMLRMMPKDLKSKIEKGQLKVVDSAPSWLGGKSEFQILQYQPVSGPSIGGQRDPYLMVIVSNPEHKPMKIFSYYGTHPSRKALMFAKNNKLLESVEVDEATKLEKKNRQLGFRAATAYVKQKGKDPSGPEAAKYNRISNALDAVRKKRASKITDSVDVHKVEHDLDEAGRYSYGKKGSSPSGVEISKGREMYLKSKEGRASLERRKQQDQQQRAVDAKRRAKLADHVEHDLDEASRPMQFPGKMSGGKMKGKFTNAQLKQLKDAYGKIGRVDPSSKAYEKLTAYLDGMDKEQLTQLVNARIQFISSLARNRLMRLDMKR